MEVTTFVSKVENPNR